MDSSQADYDMLDLLAWNCNQLSNQLIDKTDDEQETIIDEYIKRVDNEFETIKDFQEGKFLYFILSFIILIQMFSRVFFY